MCAKCASDFPLPIDLLPPVELVTTGTPQAMDAWVRQCVEENGAGELELQYHLDLGQPEATSLQMHHTLAQLGYPSVWHCANSAIF
jgi:hypothetical protein